MYILYIHTCIYRMYGSTLIQALIQKKQLDEELHNMKRRFDILVSDSQMKMQEDRDMVRRENEAILEELNNKVSGNTLVTVFPFSEAKHLLFNYCFPTTNCIHAVI